jgi:hypothetical protein
MGRLVAIKRDGARQSALALKRPAEKRFGCRDIPLRTLVVKLTSTLRQPFFSLDC